MIQLAIIGIYLALLLGLGLFSNRLFRGTSRDYMLASHSIGPFLLLMSLFGTTMTAFALIGSTGEAYKEGIGVYGQLASSSGIVHSLCFFVLGVRLWRFGYRYGYTTQIQFFRDRLESDRIGLILFPVLVGLVIPYLLIGVMGAGTVINKVTAGAFPNWFPGAGGGIPNWLASLTVCLVVLTYVFFGGMRGTAWANTFQTLVFMILGVVTFVVVANRLGGQDGLLENLRTIAERIPRDKVTRMEMSKLKFFTYMLVPLSVGMFPHLFQHWLTARSANTFKLAVVAHPIFIMIVWVPCVMMGVWATTGLIKLPPPIEANPNAVLAFMVKQLSGPVLGGLLTAGILAAIMSSLDSQFLCIGTMFTTDIVLHYARPESIRERRIVLIARAFIVGVVAVTYLLSLLATRSVFALGVWCFTGFASLFPLALAAVLWRRLTRAGAYASLLATIVSWIYFFQQSGFGANRAYTVDVRWGGETYSMMAVAPIFALSAVALVIVSLITRPPGEKTLAKFFDG